MNKPSSIGVAELDAQLVSPPGAITAETQQLAGGAQPLSGEVQQLRSTLADLRSSSMAAADFRLLAPRLCATEARPAITPRWGLAMATAALALAVAMPAAFHHTHRAALPAAANRPPAQMPQTGSAPGDNIANDALLADIQDDLSASVPASLQPLATSSTSSTTTLTY